MSHLALGVENVAVSERYLTGLGYTLKGRRVGAPNPIQKAPFVRNGLAEIHDLELLTSAVPTPPIELVRTQSTTDAQGTATRAPVYEIVLGSPAGRFDEISAETVQSIVEDPIPSEIAGVKRLPDTAVPAGAVALIIYCCDLDAALELWQDLALQPRRVADNVARLDIGGVIPGNRLSLFFFAGIPPRGPAYLDEVAVLCPSMICRDAAQLAESLDRKGYRVGECFEFAPFGPSLDIFFVQTASGELYEFLSFARSRQQR